MADIINLRRVRKEKQRRGKESEAQANRQRFGRTKAQKAADQDAAARRQRALEGKRLQNDEDFDG